jgi:hypothetical protein
MGHAELLNPMGYRLTNACLVTEHRVDPKPFLIRLQAQCRIHVVPDLTRVND